MLKLTSFMQQQDIGLSIENSADDAIKEANKLLETVEGYIPKIVEFGIKVLIAILIFAAGKIIISFILKFLKKFFEKTKVEISIR
ncbi:MAG: mechanosensitive ion channel family protein, partial [Lachnospiraceae bacterium]